MNVLRAEWTKLRTVRSTYWLLATGAVVTVGLAVLVTYALGTGQARTTGDTFDAAGISLLGVWCGQVAFGVLGVLAATPEYATGGIRTTLAAVPRRGAVLSAKLAVVGVLGACAGAVVSLVAFLAGQSVLGGQHRSVGLADPGALRAVAGAAAYLAATAALGVAVGTLVRRTAGSVLAVLSLGFGATVLGGLSPGWLGDHVLRYLPGPLGNRITAAQPPPAPADYLVLGGWVAALALLAYLTLRWRDA